MQLECYKVGEAYKFKKNSGQKMKAFLSGLNQGDDFMIKVMDKAQVRSYQQNSYYWTIVVPCCQYYLDELTWCADPKDKDIAHYQLKLIYCTFHRTDLIKIIKFQHPKTKKMEERAVPFSWKISEMPPKEANDYINYWVKRVEFVAGCNITQAIAQCD